MNPTDARQIFLKLFISFLGLTALIAIVSVLIGNFGELQIRTLITTFSISAASICAMSCAAFIEQKARKTWGVAGIFCAAIAAAMVVIGVWLSLDDEGYWKSTVTFIVLAIAMAHAFLLNLPRLDNTHRWIQTASTASIALLSLQITSAVWGEIEDKNYYKLLTVVSIIVVLLTLVTPILMKLRKEADDKPETLSLSKRPDGTFEDKDGVIYRVTRIEVDNQRNL